LHLRLSIKGRSLGLLLGFSFHIANYYTYNHINNLLGCEEKQGCEWLIANASGLLLVQSADLQHVKFGAQL
jgi:hypothetical protein